MKSILLLLFVLLSCACTAFHATPSDLPLEHVVLVWLNKPGDPNEQAKILGVASELRKIPGVIAVNAGLALPSTKPVVDSSFDVGVVITLSSAAALEAYQASEIHQRVLKEVLKPATKRYIVYDIVRAE